MALSEHENLILLQLEQSLRADGPATTRHRTLLATVTTLMAAVSAVGLICWAALAPASAWTIAATGVAGVIIGVLAVAYRQQVQVQAIRLSSATGRRLRRIQQSRRRRDHS